MLGGKRDKYTKLLASTDCLNSLSCECDGQHEHLPWGVGRSSGRWAFATAAEAEYPATFCKQYIDLLSTMVDKQRLDFTIKQFRLDTLAKSGTQAVKHKQLVSEFSAIQLVQQIEDTSSCKLLRTVSVDDGGGKRKRLEVGVYRNYTEHIQEAFKLPHPSESTDGVPDDLKRAAFNVITKGMHAIAQLRNEAMKDCIRAASELRLEEKKLHAAMEPSIEKSLQTRR